MGDGLVILPSAREVFVIICDLNTNKLRMSCLVQTDQVLSHHHLPHVDQILGQSHGLRVPRDGDGSVQVGGGVSVLAVGDPDHRSGELSAMIV